MLNQVPQTGASHSPPQVLHWVRQHILPHEAQLLQHEGQALAEVLLAQLTEKASQAGLFGLFYPAEWGGKIAELEHYLPVLEAQSYSEFAPAVFGAECTLDMHMLHQHASQTVRQRFLPGIANGSMTASYAMTEPDQPGSQPACIQTHAHLQDGRWLLHGAKWFICRAENAALFTVLARTSSADGRQGLSMLLVPRDTPGCRIVRPLPVLGRHMGQAELCFDQVSIPADYILGQPHQATPLLEQRLGLGRVLRSTQWLGLAQRCFDLFCARLSHPRAQALGLADKQLVRQHLADSHQAIISARALLLAAARALHGAESTPRQIAVISAKLAASHALCQVADHAIQIHGAEGLSDLHPLGAIYRFARATRIMDGSDEALLSAQGRLLLDQYQANVSANHAVKLAEVEQDAA